MLADVVARLRAAGCVFAEDEAALLCAATSDPARLAVLVARRVAGEPLEQVLGWAGFHGLRLRVEPGVFVPRRRSEFLVDVAVELCGARPPAVLDLCCGCGALAAALVAAVPTVLEVHACDIDPAAVRCARHNLPGADVWEGPLFAPLPGTLRGRVDVLLANVPYVPTAEIALLPTEFRDHEDHRALDGGADGLDVARAVFAAAPEWLAPGGRVLVEVADEQLDAAAAAVRAAGLECTVRTSEDAAVVIGTRLPGVERDDLGQAPGSPRA